MSATTYEILEWNETIDSSNRLRPVFTFIPDTSFVNYIQENPGPILIEIHGTDYYDGQKFGTCISSADFPTFGPNYSEATKEYVMVVDTDFTLFPSNKGTMTIDYGVRTPTLGPCSYKTLTLERFDGEGPFKYDPSKVGEEQPDDKRVVSNTVYLILIGLFALLILIVTTILIYNRYVV